MTLKIKLILAWFCISFVAWTGWYVQKLRTEVREYQGKYDKVQVAFLTLSEFVVSQNARVSELQENNKAVKKETKKFREFISSVPVIQNDPEFEELVNLRTNELFKEFEVKE